MTTFLEGNVPYDIDQLGLKEVALIMKKHRVIDNGNLGNYASIIFCLFMLLKNITKISRNIHDHIE